MCALTYAEVGTEHQRQFVGLLQVRQVDEIGQQAEGVVALEGVEDYPERLLVQQVGGALGQQAVGRHHSKTLQQGRTAGQG